MASAISIKSPAINSRTECFTRGDLLTRKFVCIKKGGARDRSQAPVPAGTGQLARQHAHHAGHPAGCSPPLRSALGGGPRPAPCRERRAVLCPAPWNKARRVFVVEGGHCRHVLLRVITQVRVQPARHSTLRVPIALIRTGAHSCFVAAEATSSIVTPTRPGAMGCTPRHGVRTRPRAHRPRTRHAR